MNGVYSLSHLAKLLEMTPKEVATDLQHLSKTLKHSGDLELLMVPAQCRSCGFQFSHKKHLTKPSKCPQCKSTWIEEPAFTIKKMKS